MLDRDRNILVVDDDEYVISLVGAAACRLRADEARALGAVDLARFAAAFVGARAPGAVDLAADLARAAPALPVVLVADPAAPEPGGAAALDNLVVAREIGAVARALGVVARRARHTDAALATLREAFAVLDERGRLLAASPDGLRLGLGADGRPVTAADEASGDAGSASRRFTVTEGGAQRTVERTEVDGGGRRVVVHADVTALADVETQLLGAARGAAATQLARSVVHDLNNAFCVISSFADLLLESTPEDDVRHEDILEIARAGARAAALTARLVAFARGAPGRAELVDLVDVVRRNETLLRELLGADAELALELDAREGPVVCDRAELEQVLVGLTARAERSVGPGGVVTLALQDEPGWVRVSVKGAKAKRDAVSTVPPPPDETLLASIQTVATRAGGRVEILGPTTALVLPKADHRVSTDRLPRARQTPRGPETVLVIEDETSVRIAIARTLGSLGYRVLEARRGADALPLVEACDVVVTDLVLPGERGSDVLNQIRELRPSVPALIVTGYATSAADGLGGVAVLTKPFTAAELARSVRNALESGPR